MISLDISRFICFEPKHCIDSVVIPVIVAIPCLLMLLKSPILMIDMSAPVSIKNLKFVFVLLHRKFTYEFMFLEMLYIFNFRRSGQHFPLPGRRSFPDLQ